MFSNLIMPTGKARRTGKVLFRPGIGRLGVLGQHALPSAPPSRRHHHDEMTWLVKTADANSFDERKTGNCGDECRRVLTGFYGSRSPENHICEHALKLLGDPIV